MDAKPEAGMIYLSVVVKGGYHHPDMGLMLTPAIGNRPDLTSTAWAADTGCFRQPDSFNFDRYLAWLETRKRHFATCLFATAPDRLANALVTLEVALPVLPLIRRRVPAALVAQDGLEHLLIPWHAFDVLFIGGSTRWKLSEVAYELVVEAKARGKWAHMGRVNSLRRLRAAQVAGYDSADGTFLAKAPDMNIPRMERWLDQLRVQPPLWPAPTSEQQEEIAS